MEGLEYGWRKSIKQHHYHSAKDDFISLCGHSSYGITASDFKEITFLADIEITPEMRTCPVCYSMRQKQIRKKIITVHKESVGFWDNSSVCPECNTKCETEYHLSEADEFSDEEYIPVYSECPKCGWSVC